jgi:hypothetical protein
MNIKLILLYFLRTKFMYNDDGICQVPEKNTYEFKPKMIYEKKILLDKLKNKNIQPYEKLKLIKENNHLFNESYKIVFSDYVI